MIERTTRVVGVAPRIDRARFAEVLAAADSPARAEAEAGFDVVVAEGVDPLFALAVFHHESGFGRLGICAAYDTKNPGNTRSSRTGAGTVIQTERGSFVKYPSWTEGWRDLARRLVDPTFVYAQRGAATIEQIIPIWAPASDGNSPESYVNAVVSFMNAHAGGAMPERQLRIALSSGHHNTDGGNALEHRITGELTEAYARALRAAGADVRVITPDGPDLDDEPGDGNYPGGLQDVARQVVRWANEGWVADLYLETHTEGVGNPNVRGVFAIYPDTGDDVDVDVRDRLGPAIAQAISQATGLPVRGSGVMSERQTGVGAQGYRLGIFLVTEPIRATTTRLIVEHGAHSSPADLAIIQSPGFAERVAQAATNAIYQFYGLNPRGYPVLAIPDVIHFENNPHGEGIIVGGGFRNLLASISQDLWLPVFGYPVANEERVVIGGVERTIQRFERCVLAWYPAGTPDGVPPTHPFHVRVLHRHELAEIGACGG